MELYSTKLLIGNFGDSTRVNKLFYTLWPPSSPDLNPFDYAIWGILENKTNATSHPNIDLLNNAIEEEWNKISEEFILKACWYNNIPNFASATFMFNFI